MTCPDCYGTGQAHGRDLTHACETCNGVGFVDGGWLDIDEREEIAALPFATSPVNGNAQERAKERAEYITMKSERGEHVLAADCWCNPIVDKVGPRS